MADNLPVGIPTPPSRADVNEMYKYMLSLHLWLKNMLVSGSQAVPFTNAQLSEMALSNDLSQSGKVFFNSDTGNVTVANVTGGTTLNLVVIS